METRIGFLTIGQSPRDDVVPEIAQLLGRDIRILERGALDGLARPEIVRLMPERGEPHLITRLRDGTSVVVGKRKIGPFLREQIGRLVEQDVRLIALLCTDEFPHLGQRERLIQPARVLRRLAVRLSRRGKIGILVPLDSQVEAARIRWRGTGLDPVVKAFNPYQETSRFAEVAESLKKQRVSLVALDCMGYSLTTAEKIEGLLERPVLSPRVALASEIGKLL